ncbi:hypothetical protein J8L04_06595 [Bacteroides fragilis]|uniref:hypothetical protein n=1 Tax=Bacteroides fragilis TaxID=817 RepID=UPI00202F07C9|nr:hypothetical protein [Bacteroides fragilis]MCM0226795.1 hypothetical protein [Bacteroides fragilis]
MGRTHPKPVRPIVAVQRAHERRVEVQVATVVLAARNRRPTVAVAANGVRPATGIAAIPRRREIQPLIVYIGGPFGTPI